MAFGPLRLVKLLAALEPACNSARFFVALSGGLDSTALLHALASLRIDNQPMALRAVHVDHGLQPESPVWAEQYAAFCNSLDVSREEDDPAQVALARDEPQIRGDRRTRKGRDRQLAGMAADGSS